MIVYVSMAGCLIKNLINLLQLYSSSMRIVDLDVKQKNSENELLKQK